MFYVHRRNSSSRTNLIQSSLSRVRGSKNTTGMGVSKGTEHYDTCDIHT